MKLIDVKLTLQGLRNVVEYEEALKSALASSASGTYGGMLVDVYVGVVSGSSPEAVKLGYEHVRQKLRGPSSAHVMALFATEDSDVEESSSDEEVGLPSRDDLLAHLNVVQGCVALIARVIERTTEASKRRMLLIPAKKKYAIWAQELRKLVGRKTRLELRAFVGSVDPVCPGLTAPGALPLAQRLRLHPGPTTVVAP